MFGEELRLRTAPQDTILDTAHHETGTWELIVSTSGKGPRLPRSLFVDAGIVFLQDTSEFMAVSTTDEARAARLSAVGGIAETLRREIATDCPRNQACEATVVSETRPISDGNYVHYGAVLCGTCFDCPMGLAGPRAQPLA